MFYKDRKKIDKLSGKTHRNTGDIFQWKILFEELNK